MNSTFRKLIILSSFLLFLVIQTSGQDPNLHIYLCFGQSNMSGQGPFTDADLIVDSRFKVLRAANHSGQTVGQFYPGAPRLGHSGSQMGPADFFGRRMVELMPQSVTIAVANIAIGGQSINLFDKATSANYIAQARNINDWWIPYLDEYGGDAYKRIIEMGQIAKQQGVIKGILFHQGEADYNNSQWAAKVKKVYQDILNDLNLNGEEVPFLMGELATTAEGGDLGSMNTTVASAAAAIPNAHVISAENCPVLKEANYSLHFTRQGYEILGARYAEKMFSLLPVQQIGAPTVTITSPTTNSVYNVGESITLSADAIDSDGTISRVDFYNGTTLLGTDYSSPYSFNWTPNSTGIFSISAKAIDNENKQGESEAISITITIPQSPYGGTPHPIPGIIQLEEFDLGGNGSAYMDDSPGSETGSTFRADEDVDIETCTDIGGGYNIGYAKSGEWLEYTVNVQTTGNYDIDLRVACNGTGRTISMEIEGNTINSVNIPNTSGWQNWETITIKDIYLIKGEQVLRITVGSVDYVNINYVEFKGLVTNTPSYKNQTNVSIYPNPFGDDGLKLENIENFEYRIYSSTGSYIESGNGGNNCVIGENLQNGIYYLKVTSPTTSIIQKIVKE